ncbi:MAG: outer membrane protein assembly factor BamD [Nitrospirae bacterium]|nr:outer membrane protein assembly factor BamD [Nitrospirota bacterium]
MYKKTFLLLIILSLLSACASNKGAEKPAFDPETSFKAVDEQVKKGFYEEARKKLEEIKVQDTSGKYTAIAQIRIGDVYFVEGLYEEAAIEYTRFLDIHPYHKYAYYAQYQLAMSYFQRVETVDTSYGWAQRALQEFERLQEFYPRNPYMDVTESRIKECRNILAEYEFYVGEFYFKKESYTAAAGRFTRLLQDYPDSKKEPDALYYLGLSYKNLDDKDNAVKALTTLIDKYPTTRQASEAKMLLVR